jgi:hypothetical protein
MDWTLAILRLLHVGGAVIWFGWGFVTDFITDRAVRVSGANGAVTWGNYITRTGQHILLPVVATVTVAAGGWLLYEIGGFEEGFMETRFGVVLSIGMTAGVIAWVWGAIKYAPIGKKVGAVMAEIGDGEATAEQVGQLDALRKQSTRTGYVSMTLLVIALVTMTIARNVGL